jgi:hypothetical protein
MKLQIKIKKEVKRRPVEMFNDAGETKYVNKPKFYM